MTHRAPDRARVAGCGQLQSTKGGALGGGALDLRGADQEALVYRMDTLGPFLPDE